MTKHEFMTQLISELHRRNVADAADIAEEYAQHFAFKLADGYTEEEIAARLGDPAALAAQFENDPPTGIGQTPMLTWLWLLWVDLFFGIFAVLLISFGIVLIACAAAFGLTGVCLIAGLDRISLVSLPPMPYWCGAILGFALLALCVLSVAGCLWYAAFCRQILRSFGRFHQNALAQGSGRAVLPALPLAPQLAARKKRHLRQTALVSLLLFAVCFVLGYTACSLSAGSPAFWHTWVWFLN